MVDNVLDDVSSAFMIMSPTDVFSTTFEYPAHESDESVSTPWGMNWHRIAQCVKHEMFPMMGTSMESAVEMLKVENCLDLTDFGEQTVETVIVTMRRQRIVSHGEVDCIKSIVARAREFELNGERHRMLHC